MNDTHNFILKNISGINSAHMLVGLYPTVWSPDFKSCVFFFFFFQMSQVSHRDFPEILRCLVCISHVLGNPFTQPFFMFLSNYKSYQCIQTEDLGRMEEREHQSIC